MCGIVGAAGNLTMKAREAFRDLLLVCQVRGRDATGAIGINDRNGYGYAKVVGTPEVLLDTKSYDRNVDTYSTKILIGHCRAKTVGENIVKNAHPFDHDNVIGVHNGTLSMWRALEGASGFQVDSDFLYSKISEEGVEATIPQIEGAYALVFWNKQDNTLNFLRNEERPLHFCWSEDKQMIFWASEAWMLSVVTRTIKPHVFENGSWTQALAPDELWSFTINRTNPCLVAKAPVHLEGKKRVPLVQDFRSRGQTGTSSNVQYQGGRVVTGPFGERRDTLRQRLLAGQMLTDLLNKQDGTQSESKSTDGSSETSTNILLIPSGSQTEKTTSQRSSRTTLSLRSTSTQNSPSKPNDDSSRSSSDSTTKKSLPFVSRRNVAGIGYITDNKTGIEYVGKTALININHKCGWCKKPIDDISDISEFVTANTAVCYDCGEQL